MAQRLFNAGSEGKIMWNKKFAVMALALAGFGFGLVPTTNAGTEVIRDYSNQGPAYNNYAPRPLPPRPVYYAPPPPIGVVVYPRPLFFGPRFGFHRFHHHRVFVRRF